MQQQQQQHSFHRRYSPATTTSQRRRTTVLVQEGLEEEYPKFSSDIVSENDNDDDDDEGVGVSSSSSSSESTSTSTSTSSTNKNSKKENANLLTQLDNFGQSLKPRAKEVNLKAGQATETSHKIGLKAKACLFWSLYMGYRGYRGFFVILPAVFRQVYQNMETAVDFRILDDDDNDNNKKGATSLAALENNDAGDINPITGKVRWRTRITVSVLAAIVTMTYVVGGLARVLMKFVKTIVSTSSLSGSFSAAAEEVEGNEDRLMRLKSKQQRSSSSAPSSSTTTVNGTIRNKKDLGF